MDNKPINLWSFVMTCFMGKNWYKIWSVQIIKEITKSLECQCSGHTSDYSCSWNYVEGNPSLYKTD